MSEARSAPLRSASTSLEPGALAQAAEVGLLGAGVVVGEGVEADDAVAALEQRLAEVRADEARCARHEARAAAVRAALVSGVDGLLVGAHGVKSLHGWLTAMC